jgi:hypothetical protein
MVTRRGALGLLASGTGMLVLAACGTTPPTATSATSGSQPKRGGTLRFAQTANPVGIDGNSVGFLLHNGGQNLTQAWLA